MASNLTKAAKLKECTVQIHPYCNGNPETVVLCHAPSDRKGWSIKSPDWWGAFGCSSCHDIIDGRRMVDIPASEIYNCFMRGVYRTIENHIETGELQKWLRSK